MKIFRISPSTLNNVEACAQRFNYSNELKLRLNGREEHYSEFGTLIHLALETYYKGKIAKETGLLTKGVNVIRASSLTKNLPAEQVEECVKMYALYLDYYKNEGWIPLEVETPFSAVLYERIDDELPGVEGLTILIEGKIDLVIGLDNIKTIVDHKSYSRKKKTPKLSNQNMCYAWVTGTHDVVLNKLGRQETLPVEKKYYRERFSYTDEELEAWRQDVIYWVHNIMDFMAKGYYPRNFTSCDKYNCEYQRLCEIPDKILRGSVISSSYKIAPDHDLFEVEE